MEQDRPAVDAIRTNIDTLGARARCDVRAQSVMTLGPAHQPYDLILLDPPYGTGAAAVALDRLLRLGWIGPATWIAAETGHREVIEVAGLAAEGERTVGKARLALLRMTT